jgi:hypothetical protein
MHFLGSNPNCLIHTFDIATIILQLYYTKIVMLQLVGTKRNLVNIKDLTRKLLSDETLSVVY